MRSAILSVAAFMVIPLAALLSQVVQARWRSTKGGLVSLHRAAMLCILASLPGCVDATEPPGIQLPTPLLHLPIGGQSVVASGPLLVTIEVKPGTGVSTINLKSNGKIPVAILSTATFDASTIDPATIDFAGAPVAQLPNGNRIAALQDVNGDGRADLVIHVVTSAIRLDVGLVEAVLTAATFGEQQITGSDWVKVVPYHVASDVTPPTGSIVSGPAANSALTSVGAVGDYAIAASDDLVGFSATPLHVIVTRTNAAGTSCVIGSGAGCAVPALRPLTFDPLNGTGAPVNEGYYSVTITLVDQAGNSTNLITGLVFLLDDPAQIASGSPADIGFTGNITLPSLIAGAVTNTFAAFAVDDIDLRSIWGVTEYPTARIRHPGQTTGTYGLPLESGPSAVNYSVTNWIRCLNSAGDFTTTTNRPSQITFTVLDQAGSAFSQPSPWFGANAQVCGTVGNTALYSFGSAAPNYGVGRTEVDIDGLNLSAAATTAVTLRAVAEAPLFVGVIPFSRVDFYYQTSGGQLVLIGTGTSTLTQTPINSFSNYSFVWNPNADVQAGIVAVVAIGVDGQGDAVMSNSVTLVVVP